MHLDIERYRPFVDHFDMEEERKVELIHIVSRMMQSFVERAFGESPEQILLGIDRNHDDHIDPDSLESDDQLHSTFNDAAAGNAAGKRRP